jgi:cation transport protein ChaC
MCEVDRLHAHTARKLENGIALEIPAAVLIGGRKQWSDGNGIFGEGCGESLLDDGRVHDILRYDNDGAITCCSSPPSEFHVHISFSTPASEKFIYRLHHIKSIAVLEAFQHRAIMDGGVGGIMGVFVFGYGSLMWNPGFRYTGTRTALLNGWRRAWCVRSTFYRGCEKTPGFVLGLKKGGSCVGVLFEISDEQAMDVLGTLDSREMLERGYTRQTLQVLHADGIAEAMAYTSDGLPDPAHTDFDIAYRQARGYAGPNSEYVERTQEFIRTLRTPSHWPIANDGLPLGGSLLDSRNGYADVPRARRQ